MMRMLSYALLVAGAVAMLWILPQSPQPSEPLRDAQEEALRARAVGTPQHSCVAASSYAFELKRAKGEDSPEYLDQHRRAELECDLAAQDLRKKKHR